MFGMSENGMENIGMNKCVVKYFHFVWMSNENIKSENINEKK